MLSLPSRIPAVGTVARVCLKDVNLSTTVRSGCQGIEHVPHCPFLPEISAVKLLEMFLCICPSGLLRWCGVRSVRCRVIWPRMLVTAVAAEGHQLGWLPYSIFRVLIRHLYRSAASYAFSAGSLIPVKPNRLVL